MSNSMVGAWDRTMGVVDYSSNTNAGGIKIGGSFPENSEERNPFNGRIDELMFFNKSLSATEVLDQFNLVSNIPGDFNRDGRVDAGDYVRWRNHLGDTDEAGINFNGDGNDVSLADFTWWKEHYGTPGSGTGGLTAVPEPASCILGILALGTFLARRHQMC